MYEAILHTHSLLRWVVFILLVVGTVAGFAGWLGRRAWAGWNKGVQIGLIASMHTQVLLGLALYVGVSPLMAPIFADFGAAMRDATLRFWAVEHIFMMILAAIVAQVTHIVAKKAVDDPSRFRRLAIGNALALLLVLAAIPWPFRAAVGRPLLPF